MFSVLSSMAWCTIMVVRPILPHGLAHGPQTCQIWYHWPPDFTEIWNHWMNLFHLELHVMAYSDSGASLICHIDTCYVTHMAFPLDSITYHWNCWMVFLHSALCMLPPHYHHYPVCTITHLLWTHTVIDSRGVACINVRCAYSVEIVSKI